MRLALDLRSLKWAGPILAAAGLWMAAGVTAKPDGLSVTDELMIKEQIREAYADYSVYLDGDGLGLGDEAEWAKHLAAKDSTLQGYSPDAKISVDWKINDTKPGNITIVGGLSRTAAAAAGTPPLPPESEGKKVVRTHFPVNIKFDKITDSVVETRAAAFVARATRSDNGDTCPYCESRPVNMAIVVYHDVWHKTPEGWRLYHSVIRFKT